MTRVIYVNGRYAPYDQANVHCEDRGFQFGDAVYEVIEVRGGHFVDESGHIQRLDRSLRELQMEPPMSAAAWARVLRECVRRNRVTNGLVYLQVSRGVGRRDFLFPKAGTPLTVVCLARRVNAAVGDKKAETGIRVITVPDPRWARCDIKTVMLLPASLEKERARKCGAQEVWFVDDEGFVTEGGSSNAWIVNSDNELITTPVTNAILRGITRTTALKVAQAEGYTVVERRFTVAEAKAAREAFVTSATSVIMPVVAIDDVPLGNGHAGVMAQRMREVFHGIAETSAVT